MDAAFAIPTADDDVAPGYAADLRRLRRMFDDARTTNTEARRESETDRDYFDGHQRSKREQEVLRRRKQPDVVFNLVRNGIGGVIGVVEQSKTDPRAYARNPSGEQSATVATQALRYIADTTHFDQTKMEGLENYLIEGTSAVLIEGAQDEDVAVTQIRWEEFFYDPRSRRNDFSDARYMGAAKWMYADDLAAIYPEAHTDITDFLREGSMGGLGGLVGGDVMEDRPENAAPWINRTQRRLMVVEMYFREAGQWMRAVFYAGQALEAGPSPYTDEDGHPTCPIVAESCYVDRENRRYGMVRDFRGPQDIVNQMHSRAMHLFNSRQLQPIDGNSNPIDVDEARRQAAMADGVIPMGYQIVPTGDMSQGVVLLMNDAASKIERFGPNPAILGRQSADSSGRAVLARQQAGMTELARVLGRFSDFELRCYRQMWARAKQFWNGPKWIRVTDDLGTPQYLQVNEPTGPMQPMQRPDGAIQLQPAQVKNHIARMDVDIVVDTVPDTATISQEQFNELMRLLGTNPMWAQEVTFTDALELSSLPNKKQIIDKITARQQQAAQAQQAQQAEQQQMAKDAYQTERTKTFSEIAKNESGAVKARAEAIKIAAEVHKGIDLHLNPPPGSTGANGSAQP